MATPINNLNHPKLTQQTLQKGNESLVADCSTESNSTEFSSNEPSRTESKSSGEHNSGDSFTNTAIPSLTVQSSRTDLFSETLKFINRGALLNRRLVLSSCEINDIQIVILANVLSRENNVVCLDLSNNRIGDLGAKALSELLKKPTVGLKALILTKNKIGNEGAKSLGEALIFNDKLKELDLTDNQIEEAIVLANSLKMNKSLSILSLKNNKIDDKTARIFLEALEGLEGLEANDTIQKLDLFCNNIDLQLHSKIFTRLEKRESRRPELNRQVLDSGQSVLKNHNIDDNKLNHNRNKAVNKAVVPGIMNSNLPSEPNNVPQNSSSKKSTDTYNKSNTHNIARNSISSSQNNGQTTLKNNALNASAQEFHPEGKTEKLREKDCINLDSPKPSQKAIKQKKTFLNVQAKEFVPSNSSVLSSEKFSQSQSQTQMLQNPSSLTGSQQFQTIVHTPSIPLYYPSMMLYQYSNQTQPSLPHVFLANQNNDSAQLALPLFFQQNLSPPK